MIFLSAAGKAVAEIVKAHYRYYELPDGYHPLVRQSVFRDARKRKDQSIVLFWQSFSAPEGVPMTKDFVGDVLYENEILRIHKHKPSVSKLFWRKWTHRFMLGLRGFYFGLFLVLVYGWMLICNALFGWAVALGAAVVLLLLVYRSFGGDDQ
jgi:hypothetical protein